ncbi:AraC family transcriptional regulator [Actinophytocola algeriensis]|uniref:AraC-like DNA-binding protein n=1 Tax=Actinophytocola algeriensis TaxID=1768010 RepID=A0A7W7QF36_9PSEU|nr:AraC family transcriptional regulator [Actinophytocola algeriensis]MBB4912348.1 AraC-like DNA-binding protein [Actinophytocola algeriensis]MBE1481079.1 AraC-like DNA-binding protein [Actinophytocola algeriensis]
MTGFDPWAPTDPLGEALHLLRMNGAFYCRTDMSAPWGMTMPAMPGHLWFHVVTAGRCLLRTADGATHTMNQNELFLVPHGQGHALLSEPGIAAPSVMDLPRDLVSDRYETLRHGGGGAPTHMVCGAIRFDQPGARHLIEVLPKTLHIGAADAAPDSWLPSLLRLMASEAKHLRPGGEEVITRLSDILVIQAIRAWLESDPAARTGWLGALHDPQLGRALALIHRRPDHAWTVAELATELAMSRSAFSARFTNVVGEPVMRYVTRWRMQVALRSFEDGRTTTAELARKLGYRSEAAFARAFKRVLGVSPGAAKKRRGDDQPGVSPAG